MNKRARSLLAVCLFYPAAIVAQDVVLRTSVTPDQAWLGQKTLLHIDVLVSEGWAQLKKVDTAALENVYLLQLESQGTRLSDTIEGTTYTGQRYELMMFARRGGTIDIPPLAVEVEVKTWGADGGTAIRQMQTPAAGFNAKLPPGAEKLRGLVSTSRLSAQQNWQPEITAFQPGDAIERTITRQADDVPGMAFMPIAFEPIEGVGVYPKEPTVTDDYNRGELSGTRIESVSYVFERAGAVEIPAIHLAWWDISSETLNRVTLDGETIEVAPAAIGETGASLVEDEQRPYLVAVIGFIVVAVLLLFIFRKRLTAGWVAWRTARAESESRYFKRLLKSLRSRDAQASVRDLMRWLDRINPQNRPALLEDFLCRYGDTALRQSMAQLLGCANTGEALPDPSPVIKDLEAARERWNEAGQRKSKAPFALPALN